MKNILKIRYYWELFENESTLDKDHKLFSIQTHPDRNPGKEEEFKLIQQFYDEAKKASESGTFGKKTFSITVSGKSHEFFLDKNFSDSTGDIYLGDGKWIKIFDNKFARLAQYEKKILDKLIVLDKSVFPFRSDGMVPKEITIASVDGQNIIIFQSENKYITLRDLMKFFPHGLENQHMGWISARLLENCYLYQQAGIIHCNLVPENIFVDVDFHRMFFSSVGSSCLIGQKSKSLFDPNNSDFKISDKTDRFSDYPSIANLIVFASGSNRNFKLTRNLINRLRVPKGLRADVLRILYDVKTSWKEEFGDNFFKLEIP